MMRELIVSGVVLWCAGLATAAIAGETLEFAAPQAWVKPHAIPSIAIPDQPAPIQALLQDSQLNFDDSGVTVYTDYAFRVTSPQGLSAAMLSVSWNPDTDTPVIHSVRVIREDKTIDVLAEGQTFSTMRRESNLEKSMLDGMLTAVLQPEDVQVGDIISYSLSITRNDPILGGRAEAVVAQAPRLEVASLSLRAQWPKSRPLRWQASADLGAIKPQKTADGTEVAYELKGVKPLKGPDGAPQRYFYQVQTEFSQFGNWGEVSALMAPLYVRASALKPDSKLTAEIEKIRAVSSNPEEQAAAALQLVQNKVRYVFLGMNQGGYIPADADTTWGRRFGDCKGKTALLLAILQGLGIKAEPALVSTMVGDGLDARLPMVEWFDHVIVRVEIAGKVYWLDGTRYGDRSLKTLNVPPYRWALPVRATGGVLEALKATPPDQPMTETLLELDATAGLDVKAPAHAEIIFRGDQAVQMNTGLLSEQPANVEKYMRSFWSDRYDFIEIEKVSWKWDQAAGELKVVMDGKAEMDWDAMPDNRGRGYEADGARLGWTSDFKRESAAEHAIPVAVDFPDYNRSRETIHLPAGGKGFSVKGESIDQTLQGYAFHRTAEIKDGVFVMEAWSRSVVPEISYKETMDAIEPLKTMQGKRVFIRPPADYEVTAEDMKAVADTKPETVDDYLYRGQTYLSRNKFAEALADFDAALKLEPENVTALAARGYARFRDGDKSGAQSDLDAAAAIGSNNSMIFMTRAAIAEASKDDAGALAAYTAALVAEPDNLTARQARALTYMRMGDRANARKDIEAVIKQAPKSAEALSIFSWVLRGDQKYDEAAEVLRKAIVIEPDNDRWHMELGGLLASCATQNHKDCEGQRKLAVIEYDRAIALNPSADNYATRAQSRPFDDTEGRRADVKKALEIDPKSSLALLAKGIQALTEDDTPGAISAFSELAKNDPKDSRAYFMRAEAYDKARDYDHQLADLRTLTELEPQNADAFNNLCWAAGTHNRDLQIGLDACNQAIAMSPLPQYYDSRALIYFHMGRYDEAVTDYNVTLTVRPDLPASLYPRGVARLRKGQTKEGQADIDKAMALNSHMAERYAEYGVKP